MRKTFLLPLLIFISTTAFAQKVDLDPFHFTFEYRNLPNTQLDTSFQTYSVLVDVSGNVANAMSKEAIASKIILQGFDKEEEAGDIRIQIMIEDLIIESNDVIENVTENKSKEGVVTKTYSYYVSVNYTFGGSADFMDKNGKLLAKGMRLYTDRSFKWTSKTYSLRSDAVSYFKTNKSSIINNLVREKMNESIDKINKQVNYQLGYPIVNETLSLWLLDSKKHPEYTAMKERWDALKPALQAVTADKMSEDTKSKISEMIKYFNEIKVTYNKDEKGHRKMRYAAYYNNAVLYSLIDDPAKTIDEANGLIANDYDTKDGKNLIVKAEALDELLKKNNTQSRHFSRE